MQLYHVAHHELLILRHNDSSICLISKILRIMYLVIGVIDTGLIYSRIKSCTSKIHNIKNESNISKLLYDKWTDQIWGINRIQRLKIQTRQLQDKKIWIEEFQMAEIHVDRYMLQGNPGNSYTPIFMKLCMKVFILPTQEFSWNSSCPFFTLTIRYGEINTFIRVGPFYVSAYKS